jgi:S-adenosylmethionine:tRNA ribosyltransferase-isomerase
LKLTEFDFELPAAQIAQTPASRRDASRLMTLDRRSGEWSHRSFSDLPLLLRPGDLLIVNDARVMPARMLGRKRPEGGKVELLATRPVGSDQTMAALQRPAGDLEWICLGKASKGLKAGTEVELGAGISARVIQSMGDGEYRVRFDAPEGITVDHMLNRLGRTPLPPYIRREPSEEDSARYQTVYASAPGSVAAPTAGLHFTRQLLDALENAGVQRASLTLEIGPGTFLPVRVSIEQHQMHAERYFIPAQTAAAIREAKERGARVVGVGTTVVRALESSFEEQGNSVREGAGETTLFIRPGFGFRVVDALLTNFHLPRSTLLMLVSAFAGRERILAAYREAVLRGYRFFSYGDAMFIGE